jgi:O-antigen/teichoic acid export membrane protein
MTKQEKLILLKNATANVARGGAAALVAIILPPFLTRLMPSESYGAWSLVLQISAGVAYLDFGIQTAVGRFVAHANEKLDAEYRDSIVSTAMTVLGVAGILCLVGSVPLVAFLPNMFKQMPSALLGDTRVALLLVAGSLAVGLPASVFNGVFVGLQRNEIPAAIVGGSRIFSALMLVTVVERGGGLIQMGEVVFAVNLMSYGLQFVMYRKLMPRSTLSAHLISRKTGRELFEYCLSLSTWSFAMLLITGLDIALVGYFQFEAVAYYAVAASLVAFLAGIQNAVFSVMVPSTATLHARGDSRELGRMVITATRYGNFLLLITGIPLILGAKGILTLWVGPTYALHGARILQVLVAANMLRLSATPYAMALVGTGQQRLAVVTAALEGVSNLAASVAGGYLFGAVGVSFGTALGSMVGVGGNLLYNMRRTAGLGFRISEYIRDGLLRPGICALPLFLFASIAGSYDTISFTVKGLALVGVLLGTGFLVWRWGLVGAEREKLLALRLAPLM